MGHAAVIDWLMIRQKEEPSGFFLTVVDRVAETAESQTTDRGNTPVISSFLTFLDKHLSGLQFSYMCPHVLNTK